MVGMVWLCLIGYSVVNIVFSVVIVVRLCGVVSVKGLLLCFVCRIVR